MGVPGLLLEGHLGEGLPRLGEVEEGIVPDPSAAALLLRSDALRYGAVPIGFQNGKVEVVLSDPRHKEAVAQLLNRPARFYLALPQAWEELFRRAYPQKNRLGEVLVQEGKLSREALKEALEVQKGLPRAKPLGEILVELGLARPEDVEEALQKQRRGGGRLEDTLVQSGKLRPEALAQADGGRRAVVAVDGAGRPRGVLDLTAAAGLTPARRTTTALAAVAVALAPEAVLVRDDVPAAGPDLAARLADPQTPVWVLTDAHGLVRSVVPRETILAAVDATRRP